MVLNEKIIQKKLSKMSAIMNEDGGTSVVEALGLHQLACILHTQQWQQGLLEEAKTKGLSYEQLKTKRIGDMIAG